MSINAIIQFVIMAREHEKSRTLLADFEYLLHQYGFEYYGVTRQPRWNHASTELDLASRWPARWPEVYVEKRYITLDPTIRYIARASGGFRWRDALRAYKNDPQSRRMEQMMRDAAAYGLKDGYVFPVYGRRGLLGNLTIGGKAIDLSPVEIALFDQVGKQLFFELDRFANNDEEDGDNSPPEIVKFTRREREVLQFLAEGNTSQEIGKILKLSSHTVDWYMNGIQEKLQARNRQHAVALAFRQGLVS